MAARADRQSDVGRIVRTVRRQVMALTREPSRLLRFFKPQYRRSLAYQIRPPQVGGWTSDSHGVLRRDYPSYDAYVEHQRSKLDLLDLDSYDKDFRHALHRRLVAAPVDWSAQSVLCLAARLGTEVKAFHDAGAFAVGIDLNPGADNPYVLPGDFHHLQFADETIDCVYSNSIDHAFDLDALFAEIRRVLRPNGLAVLEFANAETEPTDAATKWEATLWTSLDPAIAAFERHGFSVVHRAEVEFPPTFVESGMWIFQKDGVTPSPDASHTAA